MDPSVGPPSVARRSVSSLAKPSCYLVTIKRNALQFTRLAFLDAQLNTLKDKLSGVEWSDQVSYELDSLNRLHLHTICTSKKEIYYKRLVRKGWHIHFQPFEKKDMGNVYAYIMKHNQNKYRIEQLENESFLYSLDDPWVPPL